MTNLVLIGSLLLNALLVVVKIVVGILGKSNALVANGIYTLSDMVTDVVAIFGNIISGKKADSRHPFGYGKVEYITSVIVGVTLLIMGGKIVMGAFTEGEGKPESIVLVVSSILMVVKYMYAKFMEIKGKEFDNGILIASSIESKTDALATLFVVFSVILSKFSGYNHMYKYSLQFVIKYSLL